MWCCEYRASYRNGFVESITMSTWLVTEHGPVGSQILLAVADAMGRRACRMITTSLSSHILARSRGLASTWISAWSALSDDGGTSDMDLTDCGRVELARARRFSEDDESIHRALRLIARELDRQWDEHPPERVVIWERRRALGSLVTRRALQEHVPIIVLQNGFIGETLLVDRVVPGGRTVLTTWPLDEADEPIGMHWRRPGWIPTGSASFRRLATLGLWLDYVERFGSVVMGFPALIPRSYWAGFMRTRFRSPQLVGVPVVIPDDYILLALNTPPMAGRWTDPNRMLEICLDQIPPDCPLVISPHPADRYLGFPIEVDQKLTRRPNTVLVPGRPAWTFLDHARGVITLTSAIGIESLARGIPTLALSDAPYTRPGLALEFVSELTVANFASAPMRFRPEVNDVRRFVATARHRHLVGHYAPGVTGSFWETLVDRMRMFESLDVYSEAVAVE